MITPDDIKYVKFSTSRKGLEKGYKTNAVDNFLDYVYADYSELYKRHPLPNVMHPSLIENAAFGRKGRGYSIVDVDNFLDKLLNDYEKLYKGGAL